ncbi:Protein of unknown function [Cotesia congregata]|uniref:Uncharacterized protein n=1 Tax=Cotesia congregata TaxID=51543 RepID=A0A8J2HFU6_COTCN|nr:Protein of unknown function [Cotesia congregata]
MGKSKKRSRERSGDRDEDRDINKRVCRLEKILGEFIKETREKIFSKKDNQQKAAQNNENSPANDQDDKVADQQSDGSGEGPVVEDKASEVSVDKTAEIIPPSTVEDGESVVNMLDEETETVLGDNPSADNKELLDLHQSLVSRWPTWMTEGLKKETKEVIVDKYSRKGNINLEAPELNEEVLASLNETGVKRDKLFIVEQNLVGSAMAALG